MSASASAVPASPARTSATTRSQRGAGRSSAKERERDAAAAPIPNVVRIVVAMAAQDAGRAVCEK